MFNFLKSKLTNTSGSQDADAIVEEFAGQESRHYSHKLENFTAGVKYKNADPQSKRDIVMAMVAWFEKNPLPPFNADGGQGWNLRWQKHWKMRELFLQMLRLKLPYTEQDVIAILNWSVVEAGRGMYAHLRGVPQTIKVVGAYCKENPLSDNLQKAIGHLVQAIESQNMNVEARRWVLRLKELMGDTEIDLPLAAGDAWADRAISEIQTLDPERKSAWAELLLHCLKATGSAPGGKWMTTAQKHLEAIGKSEISDAILDWFPQVDGPRTPPAQNRHIHGQFLIPVNIQILKGLVWLSSQLDDPRVARALTSLAISAYKKIPGTGPRAAMLGNACFWALGTIPGEEGVAQLSILKIRVKGNNAQKAIANALNHAAQRSGMTAEEIEEMSVSSYGMEEVGLRRDEFDEVCTEVRVDGSEVEQVWTRKDGKHLSSAPKAVKDKYPEELKEISQTVKDIRRMLPAQRDRLDNLFLSQKKWTFNAWKARYLDHPLVGTIARRLIWKFTRDGQAASAIWFDGHMAGRDGKPVEWIDGSTSVELWHPIDAEPDIVLEWRQWLMEHEIRQPFKQAYREIYLLTDAELTTHVYSNRYAAHILRQHQFNSLCAAKGWKNSLRLMVDDTYPPATKTLSQWGLRVEYWIEGIGDQYGTDTNETGTYLYLTTDQVRFYRMDAVENRAHAGGGGYLARRWLGIGNAEPLPLEEIPPLVFSEVMRDVDMFVGVASVGNDPTWMDGGGEARYQDYWHSYSFGELTESSKTRKQVLESLVPRLKIAGRCKLTDKFLVVRGDIRTYKIHLGSGNILMEPNDQYLCIVPSRGSREKGKDRLFIPFEGDQTLAIILSKAFLLAEDTKITDSTIIRQIKR